MCEREREREKNEPLQCGKERGPEMVKKELSLQWPWLPTK